MNIPRYDTAFLFDVDSTLLDNDCVIADLQSHLEHEVEAARTKCYWALFERLRTELGYADYLGALLMSARTVIVAINARLLRLRTEPKSGSKAESKPEAKAEPQPET